MLIPASFFLLLLAGGLWFHSLLVRWLAGRVLHPPRRRNEVGNFTNRLAMRFSLGGTRNSVLSGKETLETCNLFALIFNDFSSVLANWGASYIVVARQGITSLTGAGGC